MNSAQHQVFNMLVQDAHESRGDLHSIAQDCLGGRNPRPWVNLDLDPYRRAFEVPIAWLYPRA